MIRAPLIREFEQLPVPLNYYEGRGKKTFSLPLNILFFYRNGFEKQTLNPETNFHYRHVLIFNCGAPIAIMVDGSRIELRKDCFTLLLPYQYHRFINNSREGLSLLFITFEMEDNLPLLALRNLASSCPSGIFPLLQEALKTYNRQKEGELPFRIATILSKLLETNRELGEFAEKRDTPASKVVNEICRRLYEDRSLNISRLCGEMNFSEGYLRSVFKKSMGITLGRYIRESRLTEAMKYLSTSDKSVSEIAEFCGYDSIYSLSRSFRTHMGISPSAYRKERKREGITS